MKFSMSEVWKTLTAIKFRGRATKNDYLNFFIFRLIVFVVVLVAVTLTQFFMPQVMANLHLKIFVGLLVIIACVTGMWIDVADLGLTVRRFHDFNKTGKLVFAYWIFNFFVVNTLLIVSTMMPQIEKLISNFAHFIWNLLIILMALICIFKNGTVGQNKYDIIEEEKVVDEVAQENEKHE